MLDPRSFTSAHPSDWAQYALGQDPHVPDPQGVVLAVAAINHPDLPAETGPLVAGWVMNWLIAQMQTETRPVPVTVLRHLSSAMRTHPDWFTEEQRSFLLVHLAGI